MFVIKYLLDEINPYVIENKLRTNNSKLAKKIKDKSESKRLAIQYGYDLNEVEFVEVD